MRTLAFATASHHAFIFVVRDAKKSSPSAFRDNATPILFHQTCCARTELGGPRRGENLLPVARITTQCPSPDTFSPRSYDYLTGPKRIGTCFQSISPPSTNNPTGHTHTHVRQQTNIVVHALRVAGYIIRLFAFSYPLIHVNMLSFYNIIVSGYHGVDGGAIISSDNLFFLSVHPMYSCMLRHIFWRAMAPLCHDMQSHNMLTMNDQSPPPDTSSIGSFPVPIRMSPFGLSVVMDA
jgi:hypothetical protein